MLFQAGVVCTRVTGRHDMQEQDAVRDQGKQSGRGAQGNEPCIYSCMYLCTCPNGLHIHAGSTGNYGMILAS